MPTLKITIKTDNAAFQENPDELFNIMRAFCTQYEGHAMLDVGERVTLLDSNGNTVGEAKVTR